MYMYICMYVYVYVCIYICTYIYIPIYPYLYLYTDIHVNIYVCMYIQCLSIHFHYLRENGIPSLCSDFCEIQTPVRQHKSVIGSGGYRYRVG